MPASGWRWRCRPRSTCCEPGGEGACGATAMADRVLLLVGELRHRQAARSVVWEEHRVVAEASLSARLRREPAGTATLEHALDALAGIDVGNRADVLQRAANRSLAAQLSQVLLVGGMLSRIARRAHAGAAAERGGDDPRVIGDAHRARRRRGRTRLAKRVLGEGVALLRRELHGGWKGGEVQLGSLSLPVEQARDLAPLVLVLG